MKIKQTLTRALINRLPADAQARMVADFIAWLYPDLSPAEQQQKIERLGPRLIALLRQGKLGLPLLTYHRLLRLPPLHRTATEALAEGPSKKLLTYRGH